MDMYILVRISLSLDLKKCLFFYSCPLQSLHPPQSIDEQPSTLFELAYLPYSDPCIVDETTCDLLLNKLN